MSLFPLSSSTCWRVATLSLLLPLSAYAQATGSTEEKAPAEKSDVAPAADPAAEKFWAAIKLLQSSTAADVTAGRAALQRSSDEEYIHAQVLLANCLLSGSYGFKQDAKKAVNLFRLAAERGNAFAKISLGSCYATGSGVWKNDKTATEWLTSALAANADFSQPPPPTAPLAGNGNEGVAIADAGQDPISSAKAAAHYHLAEVLTRQKKLAEAQEHYVAAAGVDSRSGIYEAATKAALNYALGQGVPRDSAKATAMLERSRQLTSHNVLNLIHNYVSLKMVDEFAVADLEDTVDASAAGIQADLQVDIAKALRDKKSKDYNPQEAAKWLEIASESGRPWATLELAFMHAKGELGQADPAAAFRWFEKAYRQVEKTHDPVATKHLYVAAANLAICHQNGFGTAKDTAKADALFQKYRDREFVSYLGSIGQCPPAPMTLPEMIALHQKLAADKNDAAIHYLLGLRYLAPWGGVSADLKAGEKWLQRAAKANHGGALAELGLMAEKDSRTSRSLEGTLKLIKASLDYYRRGSDAGNAQAMASYAGMLFAGRGIAKDEKLAEELYLKSLQLVPDDVMAHNNLGVLYATRLNEIVDTIDIVGKTKYRALMLEHYEAAVAENGAQAALNLGDIYYQGRLMPRELQKAYTYYEQAASLGLQSAAHHMLGVMHENGEGVPVTPAEAAYHYRMAALDGNQKSLRRLVEFYQTGTGVSRDLDRALFWMYRLADMGDLPIMTDICDILMQQKKYAEAVPILQKMLKLQNSFLVGYAYGGLAYCYEHGLGVKADQKTADKYYDEARKYGSGHALYRHASQLLKDGKNQEGISAMERAASSSPDAAFAIGRIYYFGGYGVEQNRRLAMTHINRAANGRQPEAMYFLAALVYNNELNAPLTGAIELAQKAKNMGHPQAAELVEKLEQRRLEKEKAAAPEESTRVRSS